MDRKDLDFFHLCLIGEVEKWRDEIFFCLVEMKNKRIKNEVGINLSLYLY